MIWQRFVVSRARGRSDIPGCKCLARRRLVAPFPSPSGKNLLDEEQGDIAFCRVTQMALLRLLTSPAITGPDVLSRREAWDAFEKLLADPRIRIMTEPQGLESLWAA